VTDILSRESDATQQRAPAMEDHDEYLTYLVRDASGNILLRSHDTDITVFGARPEKGFYDTATHRIYGASAVSNTLFIEVAEPLAHRREAAFEAGLALLLPLLFLIPVSLIGVWWAVRFSLRQVVGFRESLEARGAGDLSSVATEQLPEEFEPIAASINRLLERLRRALEAERSFTANSAHELRTPLATALAKVQRLKTELFEETSLRKACEIEESLRDLSRLSQKLLELAKAEGGGIVSEEAQDLVPVLQTIIDDYERMEPGRIDLKVPDTQVASLLDPDAFAILTRNLTENALKHGTRTEPVEVRLSAEGTLNILNGGDIVTPHDLSLLRNRFVRSKTEVLGSGLGLAIVEAIAEGAGMELALHSPARGRVDGFEAELNVVIKR